MKWETLQFIFSLILSVQYAGALHFEIRFRMSGRRSSNIGQIWGKCKSLFNSQCFIINVLLSFPEKAVKEKLEKCLSKQSITVLRMKEYASQIKNWNWRM